MSREPDGLREFIAARSPSLMRSAVLLTGHRASAEDLLQAALIKTWRNWRRIVAVDRPELLVRRIMLHEFLGARRRRWTGEHATVDVPDQPVEDPALCAADDRAVLSKALQQLPRGQRAVVICRYYDDLSEAQTAELLGISRGTVKSQSAKGLDRLRTLLEEPRALSRSEPDV